MTVEITRYRAPRARVAIAYSTKDRTDFTRTTIGPLIDDEGFDLYWFDGSATDEGCALPAATCPGRPASCELHQGVIGGPDSAILYMLQALQPKGYDLVVLVENDILVSDGWYPAVRAAMAQAEAAGFRVGAASARVYAQRVLSFNDDYALLTNSGAAFVALTPPAIDILLRNYRTVDSVEFLSRFQALTGLDLTPEVEFQPKQVLSCDFFFDLLLYLHGYVVAAPPVSYVRNIDGSDEAGLPRRHVVADPGQHLPGLHRRIDRPDQLKRFPFPFYRFAPSPLSERLLAGCHQLRLAVGMGSGTEPLHLHGAWRRRWLQGLGPFTLSGSGHMSLVLYGKAIGLLIFARAGEVELFVSTPTGVVAEYKLAAGGIADVTLGPDFLKSPSATIEVRSGELDLIGLTLPADGLSYYVNAAPALDHLPL